MTIDTLTFGADEHGASLETLLERADHSKISSIKEIVTEITRLLNDSRSTAKHLKDIIKKDPPLAVQVLKSASSVYYHPPQSFDDIEEAIIWIGFERAAELAIHQKVCEIFRGTESYGRYSRQQLWKHSIAVAHGAKLLYRREFGEKGEDAYTAGLLLHLGIILEDQFLNEAFRQILKLAEQTKLNLAPVEREFLGFDHADIGAALLAHWRLPRKFRETVGTHHRPEQASQDFTRLALTLVAIDQSCQARGIGFQDTPFREESALNKVCKRLSVKRKALNYIMDTVEANLARMESTGGLFGVD